MPQTLSLGSSELALQQVEEQRKLLLHRLPRTRAVCWPIIRHGDTWMEQTIGVWKALSTTLVSSLSMWQHISVQHAICCWPCCTKCAPPFSLFQTSRSPTTGLG